MHELAITESVVTAVAERVGTARVRRLSLEIGKLSGVVPDAIRTCFDVCVRDTVLEGAMLEIVEIPGRGFCHDCARKVDLPDLIALCPCGSANVEIRTGQELRIREAELV